MPLEQTGARVLGAVDAVAEAHQPLAAARAGSRRSPRGRPTRRPRRASAARAPGAPPCSGPESAPTADESAAAQSAPVEAVIRATKVEALRPCSRGADPVGVDRLHVLRIGLAAPLEQEALGGRLPLRDHGRDATRSVLPSASRADWAAIEMNCAESAARGPRAPRRRRCRSASSAPTRRRRGRSPTGDRPACCRSGRRPRRALPAGRPGSKLSSTSRPHTCSNAVRADELLDVDAAVAERAAVAVGLGDLRLEGDDALEAWLEVGHARTVPQRGSRTG